MLSGGLSPVASIFFFFLMCCISTGFWSGTTTFTVEAQSCKTPFQYQILTFATIHLCNLGKMLIVTVSWMCLIRHSSSSLFRGKKETGLVTCSASSDVSATCSGSAGSSGTFFSFFSSTTSSSPSLCSSSMASSPSTTGSRSTAAASVK